MIARSPFDRDPNPPEPRYTARTISLWYEARDGREHRIDADVLEDGELDRVRVVTEHTGPGPLHHWRESVPAEDVLDRDDFDRALALLDDLAAERRDW